MSNYHKGYNTTAHATQIHRNAFAAGDSRMQRQKGAEVGADGAVVVTGAGTSSLHAAAAAGRTQADQLSAADIAGRMHADHMSAAVTADRAAAKTQASGDKAEAAHKTAVPVAKKIRSRNRREPERAGGFRLDFKDESLLNSVILSEVLSKPKCLRKGRW